MSGSNQIVQVNQYISTVCSLGLVSFLIMLTFKYKAAEEEESKGEYNKIVSNDREEKIQRHT